MSTPTDWSHFYNQQNPTPPTPPSTTTTNNLTPEGRVTKPIRRRSRASRRTPTTLLNTDTTNFRAMVQQFTGGGGPLNNQSPYIPPQSVLGHGFTFGQGQVNSNNTNMLPLSIGYRLQYQQNQNQNQPWMISLGSAGSGSHNNNNNEGEVSGFVQRGGGLMEISDGFVSSSSTWAAASNDNRGNTFMF